MTQSSLRDLRIEVSDHMDRLLADHGLARKRSDEYLWPLADGFQGWLSLIYHSRPEAALIDVDPLVGVRSTAIEHVAKQLGGDRRSWLSSASTQLWNLTPDRSSWLAYLRFETDQPIGPPAQELIAGFEMYGRPWAEARATLPALREELAREEHPAPAVACRRIAAHLLCGDRAAAEADLRAAEQDARERAYDPLDVRGLVATWTSRFLEVAAAVLEGSV